MRHGEGELLLLIQVEVAALIILLIVVGIIIASPKPTALRTAQTALPPRFDAERRLDFTPGLRNRLSMGNITIYAPRLPAARDASATVNTKDQVESWIVVPGLTILGGLPDGTNIPNGTPADRTNFGAAFRGDKLTLVRLPSTAYESFRMGVGFFGGAGNQSGKINFTRDATQPRKVRYSAQRRPSDARIRNRVVQKLPANFKSTQVSPITTGSTNSPSNPTPPPAALPFLGFLSPQEQKTPAPVSPPTGQKKPWAPEPLGDVYQSFY